MKKPNLFIIGAPKCGTTSMAYYLGQHPNIFFSKIKEPHYFNYDSNHRYYFNEKEYLNNFKNVKPQYKYLAEGSVWYLFSKVAIDNILKFNPESKFIVMLRNPVDMYFSLHQELLFGGTENIKSPIKAWNLQEERLQGKNIPIGCTDKRFLNYKESCSLGKQVNAIINKIDKTNIIFITLDELKNSPNEQYLNVLNFLNIDEISLKDYKIINKKKIRRSYFLSSVLKIINVFKNSLGIRKGVGIANKINKLNVRKDVSIINNEDYEQLAPIIKEYFKNDIDLLEKLINKDLKSWK